MSDYLSNKAERQSLTATGQGNAFAPDIGRPVRATISGVWVGTVKILRSYDRGATWSDMTIGGAVDSSFTSNVNEYIDVPLHGGVQYAPYFTRTSGTAVVELGH